ncbi:hypothetical protein WAI453_013164 [Rhynchosporium graminicola]
MGYFDIHVFHQSTREVGKAKNDSVRKTQSYSDVAVCNRLKPPSRHQQRIASIFPITFTHSSRGEMLYIGRSLLAEQLFIKPELWRQPRSSMDSSHHEQRRRPHRPLTIVARRDLVLGQTARHT